MTPTDMKRLRLLYVSCSPAAYRAARVGGFVGLVPAGGALIGHRVSPELDAIQLKVRHPDYAPVPEGELIPSDERPYARLYAPWVDPPPIGELSG